MIDHTMSQKKEYTPEMIKEELRSNVAFSEVEEIQDQEQKKKKLDEERKNYIEQVMGESLEKNAKLMEKMDEQEEVRQEKSKKKSIKSSGKKKIKAIASKQSSFVQKLPKVKNSRKFWQVWKPFE